MQIEGHPCPTPEGIVDRLLGRIDLAQLDAWDDHVDRCLRCRDLTARYESARDSLLCELALLTPPVIDSSTQTWIDTVRTRIGAQAPDSPEPVRAWLAARTNCQDRADDKPEMIRAPTGYECGRRLGAGGFGVTHVAFHLESGRMAAIKMPLDHQQNDARVLARFEREAHVLAQMDHPAIVKRLDAGHFDDGAPYLVMELLSGDTLAESVRRLGPLPVSTACRLTCDLLAALEHARERGIVHRDVAPKNVFWEADGSVRLADWGLARIEADSWGQEERRDLTTNTGEFWGTPTYAAPEQWSSFKSCDSRTDIYAVGCTLVHLLTGASPGPALAAGDSAIKVGSNQVLLTLRPDLPPGLVQVLRQVLRADPERRPETPRECAKRFRPFAASEPAVAASRPGPGAADDGDTPLAPSLLADECQRTADFVADETVLLAGVESPVVATLCQSALEACTVAGARKPVRVALVGAAGAGKTELLRTLMPELPDLSWQTPNARVVSVYYASHYEASARKRAGAVVGQLEILELASAAERYSSQPLAVSLGLPSDFLSRGFVIEEVRPNAEGEDPFPCAEQVLRDSDAVVWCVPSDLGLPAADRIRAMLAQSGHEAVLWVLTRMDSVRRDVEVRRLIEFGRSSLSSETTLGADGVVFVSCLEGGCVFDEAGQTTGTEGLHQRLLQYLGPWSSWIRARRPLVLLQRAVEAAKRESDTHAAALAASATRIQMRLDTLAASGVLAR